MREQRGWLAAVGGLILCGMLWAQPRALPPIAPTVEIQEQPGAPPALAIDPRLEERLRRAQDLLPIEGIWAVRLERFDTTGGEIRMVREDYTVQLLIIRQEEGAPEHLTASVIATQSERIPLGAVLAHLQPTADPQLYLAEWYLPGSRPAWSELKMEGAAVAVAELRDVPRYPLVASIRMLKLRPRPWRQPAR